MAFIEGDAIKGLDEITRVMREFPDKIKVNVVRGGARAGAKVIAAEAKQSLGAHKRTGALQQSVRIATRSRGDYVTGTVKVGNKRAWYAHLVEFATSAHLIKPSKKRALSLPGGRAVSVIHHPGTPERPFLRPALEKKAHQALDAMAAYMRARLGKEAVKRGMPAPEFTEQDERV